MHSDDWGVFQIRRGGVLSNDRIFHIKLCLYANEFFFLYFYCRCACMLPGVWQCLVASRFPVLSQSVG